MRWTVALLASSFLATVAAPAFGFVPDGTFVTHQWEELLPGEWIHSHQPNTECAVNTGAAWEAVQDQHGLQAADGSWLDVSLMPEMNRPEVHDALTAIERAGVDWNVT